MKAADLLPTSRRGRLAVAATLMVVVATALVSPIVPRIADLSDDAAFQIRDTVVTKSELRRRVDLLVSLFGVRPPAEGPAQDAFRRDTAKAIAVTTILEQAAAQRGIVISDKAARDNLTKLLDERIGPRGQGALDQLLAQSGLSRDDLLAELKRQQVFQQLYSQVTAASAATVTDVDVRRYYRDHRAEMATPEQRRLRNIVVADRAKATAVLERLRAGADFPAIAQQATRDDSTRASGGDLGLVTRRQLDDRFADAAFGAPAGALFGPVRTPSGWNVGQVQEIRPPAPLSFEQVQAGLTQRLRSERANSTWRAWLGEQIVDADVSYADEFEPADPNALPDEPSEQTVPPDAVPVLIPTSGLGVAVVFVAVGLWGRRTLAPVLTAGTGSIRTTRWRALRRDAGVFVVGGVVVAAAATAVLIFGAG